MFHDLSIKTNNNPITSCCWPTITRLSLQADDPLVTLQHSGDDYYYKLSLSCHHFSIPTHTVLPLSCSEFYTFFYGEGMQSEEMQLYLSTDSLNEETLMNDT
jgi:hypothetical protein